MTYMEELKQFSLFFRDYLKSRLLTFGNGFESIKNIIVAFLIVKRGKYSNSFLNTSFFLLVAAVVIAGPTIVENNPFINQINVDVSAANQTSAIISYNPYENPLSTVVSTKPRDKVENYPVKSGDTLASIAQKFDISVDTIKWANDLKTDTIKPGQTMKIPPMTGIVHKVSFGENIYTIAKKYKTDAQNIVNFPFNDFADTDTFQLTSGQTLYVPGGVIEAEKPTSLTGSAPVFAQIQAGVKGTSNFIWPTSGLITTYPVWYHMALDIANNAAPTILAADTGTVISAGWNNTGYGNSIIIDHANGYRTLYGHLSRIDVVAGQAVTQGQAIGKMGSTGRSTGTHLHFEIRSGETLLNPLNFLK